MIKTLFVIIVMNGGLFARQSDSIYNSNSIKRRRQAVDFNNNIDVAITHAESILKLAEQNKDEHGAALACYSLGKLYGTNVFDFRKGIYYHEKSLRIASALHDVKLIADNSLLSGMLYYHLGLYGKALEQLLTSVNIYTAGKDFEHASFARVGIAAIYSEQGGKYYSKAKNGFYDVLKEAKAERNDSLLLYATSYYTSSLIAHNQFETAEKYLNSALKLSKSDTRYVFFTQVLYSNLGDVFFHDGLLKAAINQFEMAHEICVHANIKPGIALAALNLGRAYFNLGENVLAKRYYDEALQRFKTLGMGTRSIQTYDALSTLENNQHDFKEAFRYKALQCMVTDSLYALRNDLLFDVQSRAYTGKAAFQKKYENVNWLALSLVFLVLLLSCFLGLIYLNHQRLRSAKSRSMLVNENLILEKELQNKRLEEERLIQQLEFNAKTLTTNTLNMIQKNEILLQIKEKAEILRTSFPENFLPVKVKDLIHLVNFGLNIDKDWDNFKIHFEQVHTDFFDQLKASYPALNSSDLKLCALLKLNLDTKEIAAIMNISPPSVKVARSRLRKKLKLGITSNLSSFITQIQ